MNQTNTDMLTAYIRHLQEEERSQATVKKYVHDIGTFLAYVQNRQIEKPLVLAYKEQLRAAYKPASVNSMLVAVNGFLRYNHLGHCCVKQLKVQRQIFCGSDAELSKEEYMRLLKTAGEKKDKRLYVLLQTICATGIRISELQFITVEAVQTGKAFVECKGKNRVILLPAELCRMIKQYIRRAHLRSGSVFVTRSGRPVDRSNIWREMKSLCKKAHVAESKVFPHNLRHLFARCFYTMTHDIAKLADILGHASVDTTRIYMVSDGSEHRIQMDHMGLTDQSMRFIS